MVSYPGGHATFLLAAILTHATIGVTLGAVAFDRPEAGAIAAILPDVDLLFPAVPGQPFVHRGITHTLLAAVVLVAITSLYDRRIAGAAGIGYLSHLLVDATTPMGVPLGYPLVSGHIEVGLHGHSPRATLAILGVCFLVLAYRRFVPPASHD